MSNSRRIVQGWKEQGYSDLFKNGPVVYHDCNHFPITPMQICTCPPQQNKVQEYGAIATTSVYNPFTNKVVDVYSILRALPCCEKNDEKNSPKPTEAYALGRQIHWGGFSQIHVASVLEPFNDHDREQPGMLDTHENVEWKVTDRQVAIKITSRDSSITENNGHETFQEDMTDISPNGTTSFSASARADSFKEIFEPLDEVSAIHLLNQQYHHHHLDNEKKQMNSHVIHSIATFVDCVPQYNWIFMVMPLCHGGELLEYVALQTHLIEEEARSLFIQILEGLSQCHRLGLAHLDLSLENVLLKEKVHRNKNTNKQGPHLVIIDFGACMLLPTDKDFDSTSMVKDSFENDINDDNDDDEEKKSSSSPTMEMTLSENDEMVNDNNGKRLLIKPINEGGREHIGKLQYTCPELLDGNKPWDGFTVDLWSCGIMLFIMLVGREPWRLAQDNDFYFSVVQEDGFQKLFSLWGLSPHQYPSKEAQDLLQRLLHKDPHQRLTRWTDIESHPWFRGDLKLDD